MRFAEEYSDTYMSIGDFQAGQDRIDVSAFGISNFDQLALIADNKDSSIRFDAYYSGAQHVIDAEGGVFDTLTSSDFVFDTSGAKNTCRH